MNIEKVKKYYIANRLRQKTKKLVYTKQVFLILKLIELKLKL